MDLDHIAEKIEDDKYESLSDLVADVTLMAANAQKFNMPRSPIWYDAGLLMKHAKMSRRRICLRRKFAGTDILEREARKRMLAEAGGLGGGNGKRRRSTDPAAAFASAAAASSSSAAASSAAACPTEGQLSFDTVHIEQVGLKKCEGSSHDLSLIIAFCHFFFLCPSHRTICAPPCASSTPAVSSAQRRVSRSTGVPTPCSTARWRSKNIL